MPTLGLASIDWFPLLSTSIGAGIVAGRGIAVVVGLGATRAGTNAGGGVPVEILGAANVGSG
eukprot:COSAG01_NODE_7518_length_3169_cov_5.177524_7_plen_62_part_00